MMKLKLPKIVDWQYDYKTCEYKIKFAGCEWEVVSKKDFDIAVQIATSK